MNEESFVDVRQYSVSDATSETDKIVWNQTVYIVNSHVSTKVGLSSKKLVGLIATTVAPLIVGIDVKLSKVRTNTETIIYDSLKVYSAIYIYSAIVFMIVRGDGLLFKVKSTTKTINGSAELANTKAMIGGKSANKKSILQDNLKLAINLLVKTYNAEIRTIGLSIDDVKQKLLSAYIVIRNQDVDTEIDNRGDTIATYLASDPIYNLIANTVAMIKHKPIDLSQIDEILPNFKSDNPYNVDIPTFGVSPMDKFTHYYMSLLISYASTIWIELAFPESPTLLQHNEKLAEVMSTEEEIFNKINYGESMLQKLYRCTIVDYLIKYL